MRHSRSLPQSLQFICDCGESIAARSTSVWRRNFHQDKGESGSFEILKHASEDPTLPRAKRKCSTCQCSVEHVYFQQVRRSGRCASLPDARCVAQVDMSSTMEMALVFVCTRCKTIDKQAGK